MLLSALFRIFLSLVCRIVFLDHELGNLLIKLVCVVVSVINFNLDIVRVLVVQIVLLN